MKTKNTAASDGELTHAERTLLKRVKTLKQENKKLKREKDILVGILQACGVRSESVESLLFPFTADGDPSERDRHR